MKFLIEWNSHVVLSEGMPLWHHLIYHFTTSHFANFLIKMTDLARGMACDKKKNNGRKIKALKIEFSKNK